MLHGYKHACRIFDVCLGFEGSEGLGMESVNLAAYLVLIQWRSLSTVTCLFMEVTLTACYNSSCWMNILHNIWDLPLVSLFCTFWLERIPSVQTFYVWLVELCYVEKLNSVIWINPVWNAKFEAIILCNKHLIPCQPLTFLVLLSIMIFTFPTQDMISCYLTLFSPPVFTP